MQKVRISLGFIYLKSVIDIMILELRFTLLIYIKDLT